MEDERLNKILAERDKALEESNSTYQQIMDNNQNLYDKQMNTAAEAENYQNYIADQNYESSQRLINQQRDKAKKENEIENQKAYNEYQKVINPYGTDVEKLDGLNNSGYSETFKLGAYNAYQNRVGRANSALMDAFTQYDNAMLEAKKDNDVTKAQNALNKLQMQIEYATNLNGENNNALTNKLNTNQSIKSSYDNSYQNMMSQIQNEKELEEKIRQYNENMAYQKERDRIADEQWQKEYALSQASLARSYYSGGSSSSSNSGSSTISNASTNDGLGNSVSTQNKSDYYWKNSDGTYTTQPAYINNTRLTKAGGLTAGELGVVTNGTGSGYRIWKANGNYYVWNSVANTYLDVTDNVKHYQKGC